MLHYLSGNDVASNVFFMVSDGLTTAHTSLYFCFSRSYVYCPLSEPVGYSIYYSCSAAAAAAGELEDK